MIKCKVCGRLILLRAKDRYEIIKQPSVLAFIKTPTIFECFDCPRCGCQNIVNTREKNEV